MRLFQLEFVLCAYLTKQALQILNLLLSDHLLKKIFLFLLNLGFANSFWYSALCLIFVPFFLFTILSLNHDLVHRVENVYARLCPALVSILRHQDVKECTHHEL